MGRTRLLVLGLLAIPILPSRTALASDCRGVPLPESVVVDDTPLELNGWKRDMASGDETIFDDRPGAGLVVRVNAERRGALPGADFPRTFLGNWLGPHAVDARLEAGLLGAPCD